MKKISLFVLLFIIAVIPITVLLSFRSQDPRSRAATPTRPLTQERLTQRLLDASADYKNSPQLLKSLRLNNLKNAARERKTRILQKLKENPQEVAAELLSIEKIQEIAVEIKEEKLIEEPVTVRGTLKLTHFDDFENRTSRQQYQITNQSTNKSEYELYFLTPRQDARLVDKSVEVAAFMMDSSLMVTTNAQIRLQSPVQYYEPDFVLGQKKVAIILFNFLSDTSQPATTEAVRQSVLGNDSQSVKSFMSENSFGRMTLTGDVFGYVTLPLSPAPDVCDFEQWGTDADAAVTSQGVNLADYEYRLYFLPGTTICPWSGVASSKRAWVRITNQSPYPPIIAHELGHTFRLSHAQAIFCGSEQIGDFAHNLSTCSSVNYGDIFNTMGGNQYYNQFSPIHRAAIGWIDQADIREVDQNGNYDIVPQENNVAGTKAIQINIPNADRDTYFITYRQPLGFDANLPPSMTGGIDIHLGDRQYPANQTYLLDLHPPDGTSEANPIFNAALTDGETFTDRSSGITIRQVSHDTNKATINVNIDQSSICLRRVPSINVTPTQQTGQVQQTLTYNVSITNNDNTFCPPTEFFLSSYYNNSWVNVFNPSRITLSSGQSNNTQLSVRPTDPNTAPGVHLFQIYVSGAHPYHQLTSQAVYEIPSTTTATVHIQPTSITVPVNGAPVGLSTLLYDASGNPIWDGVVYNWGMSSTNSVGTVRSSTYGSTIATFTPLHEGVGSLFVTATYQNQTYIVSIPVTVTSPSVSPQPSTVASSQPSPSTPPACRGDVNSDGTTNASDVLAVLLDYLKIAPPPPLNPPTNLNGDTKVNMMDFGIVFYEAVNGCGITAEIP